MKDQRRNVLLDGEPPPAGETERSSRSRRQRPDICDRASQSRPDAPRHRDDLALAWIIEAIKLLRHRPGDSVADANTVGHRLPDGRRGKTDCCQFRKAVGTAQPDLGSKRRLQSSEIGRSRRREGRAKKYSRMCKKAVGNKTSSDGLFCSGERLTQIIGHRLFFGRGVPCWIRGIEQSLIATLRRRVAA